MASDAEAGRACLHCALLRALGTVAPVLAARGLELRLSLAEPVFLPESGARLYRVLRGLLHEAAAAAARPGPFRLAVVGLCGKSHVEVTVAVPAARGTCVLSRAFPRFAPAMLARGFAEGLVER